jgi:hypothetical protein
MFELVKQKSLGKKHHVNNRLISTLDRVNYFKRTIFQRSTKPIHTSQNRVEISLKNIPCFKHAPSGVAPRISMDEPEAAGGRLRHVGGFRRPHAGWPLGWVHSRKSAKIAFLRSKQAKSHAGLKKA